MRGLWLLAAAAAGVAVMASAQAQDPGPGICLLDTLTKGVPAPDLRPPSAEVEAEAARAAGLLDAAGDDAARARCDAAVPVLEALCVGLIQPEAARSQAVCYARTAELAGACRAGRAP